MILVGPAVDAGIGAAIPVSTELVYRAPGTLGLKAVFTGGRLGVLYSRRF